jgi:hypothetical protein
VALILSQDLISSRIDADVREGVSLLRVHGLVAAHLAHGGVAEPVSALVDNVLCGLLFRKIGVAIKHAVILDAVRVGSQVTQVLAAEGADQVVLFQFASIPINKFRPLFHLIAGFLIELILIEVIFFLEFLRHLPNDVILHLEEAALLLVVFDQQLALSEFPRQVVWVNIYVNFELLGNSIFDVFVKLSVVVQKCDLVRGALLTRRGNLLHKHQDFVDPRDVLLNLCQVVAQNRSLDPFS